MDSNDKYVETSSVIIEKSMGESSIARQQKTSKMHSSVHSCDLGIVLILKNFRKLSNNKKNNPFGRSYCTRQDVSIS